MGKGKGRREREGRNAQFYFILFTISIKYFTSKMAYLLQLILLLTKDSNIGISGVVCLYKIIFDY